MFELIVNELFFRAYERSTVLRATGVPGNKAALAHEKFAKARDRASRWKFIVGDLLQGSSPGPNDLLALRYLCLLAGTDVGIAGHVWSLQYAIQSPMMSYSTYSIL